jgi:hypothetical protein
VDDGGQCRGVRADRRGSAGGHRSPRYRGLRGAYLLRRETGEETEFATALLFDGIDAVRELAGEDYELAYVPDNARAMLARYDQRSAHFEILLTPDETSWPASLSRPPLK